MKSLLLKSIFLLSVVAMTLSLINMAIVKYGNVFIDGTARILVHKREMVMNGKLHGNSAKHNILFIGSSNVLQGIIPEEFDKRVANNIYSLNMGLPGASIATSCFYLKEYLANNKPPEYVVLMVNVHHRPQDTGNFNKYATQGLTFEEALSYIRHGRLGFIPNVIFPLNIYYQPLLKYFYNITCNNNISEMKNADTSLYDNLLKNRGFFGNDNVLDPKYDKHITPNNKPGELDPKSEPYIDEFLKMTQKYKIKVMIIQNYCLSNKFSQYGDMPLHFRQILENYDNVYMAKNGYKFKFYNNEMFCDPTHLNVNGAKLYTEKIAHEFIEVFGNQR